MYQWSEFPYKNPAYDYPGEALNENWDKLHEGDQEPFPQDERLREAWRCYHRGDFQQAVNLADDPNVQVLNIAFASGFNSKSTFNQLFKKATGSTPPGFRKGLRAEQEDPA